jgi:hypothetical protein
LLIAIADAIKRKKANQTRAVNFAGKLEPAKKRKIARADTKIYRTCQKL